MSKSRQKLSPSVCTQTVFCNKECNETAISALLLLFFYLAVYFTSSLMRIFFIKYSSYFTCNTSCTVQLKDELTLVKIFSIYCVYSCSGVLQMMIKLMKRNLVLASFRYCFVEKLH